MGLEDEYFTKRKLYPNVDFYSGIVLRAIGIPTSMFTVMFAMSRTVGWVTQWNEMVSEGQMRIGRPRQLYVGKQQKSYPGAPHRRRCGAIWWQCLWGSSQTTPETFQQP